MPCIVLFTRSTALRGTTRKILHQKECSSDGWASFPPSPASSPRPNFSRAAIRLGSWRGFFTWPVSSMIPLVHGQRIACAAAFSPVQRAATSRRRRCMCEIVRNVQPSSSSGSNSVCWKRQRRWSARRLPHQAGHRAALLIAESRWDFPLVRSQVRPFEKEPEPMVAVCPRQVTDTPPCYRSTALHPLYTLFSTPESHRLSLGL